MGTLTTSLLLERNEGKGIGSALVTPVEGVAKSQGCHVIKTDTTENADGVPWEAYSFWTRMGYQGTGARLPTDYNFREIPLIKRFK